MKSIVVLWQREVVRYGRDWVRVISSAVQPLTFLVIFGFGFQSTLSKAGFGIGFLQFMYPGIIAMNIMGVAMFSTISTVWDREFGFLKEILVAPVSRTSIALGKTLGATTISAVTALILLVIAPFLGIHLSWYLVVFLFLMMVLLAFTISGFGLLVASLMDSTERFGIVMQFIVFPMFFLSGAFFPLTSVPHWMAAIARFDPLAYGVDAMRQIMLRGQENAATLNQISLFPIHIDVLFLVGISLALLTIAVVVFNKRA
jgi:ABC-2 type transport system permease protein